MKKRLLSIILVGSMVFGLSACSRGGANSIGTSTDSEKSVNEVSGSNNKEKAGQLELTVFAAASLTETLNEIGRLYAERQPEVELVFNFDSSGTLKTQIQEGADCDLFISAGQAQMDQIDGAADSSENPEGLDLVLEGSRKDILENKVVLCNAENVKISAESFDDMAQKLQEGVILLGMGNSDVPVGQYTEKILKYYGMDAEELDQRGLISYGSNVKEVITQIQQGAVSCGVVYGTDAYSAGLPVADEATEEMCGKVVYPAAVIKDSGHPREAQDFLDFLQTEECTEIFEKVGFSPVGQGE